MSQVSTAKKQIKRYGFKGAAILTPVTSTENISEMTVTPTPSTPINLLSYAGKFPSSRIDGKTIFASDRRVLAAPDVDWDGTISPEDEITIESLKYNIEDFTVVRVGQAIAYVEIQCRG